MYRGEFVLEGKLQEIYTKDGKNITEIIQEWVQENNEYFCPKKVCIDTKSIENR